MFRKFTISLITFLLLMSLASYVFAACNTDKQTKEQKADCCQCCCCKCAK